MNHPTEIHKDGTIECPGVNFGPRSKPPTVLYQKGVFYIFKIPGHTGWSGQGQQSYYKTSVGVARLGVPHRIQTHCRYSKTLFQFTPGRQIKGVVEKLKVIVDNLDAVNTSPGVEHY